MSRILGAYHSITKLSVQELVEKTQYGSVFVFTDFGNATNRGAKISAQKQAGHIAGTPQNKNRIKQGKPTSSFFGKKSGDKLTQDAFQKGTPVAGRPNVKEHDFGISVGTGPKGGMQTKVHVHQDSKGKIHGHPSGPEGR